MRYFFLRRVASHLVLLVVVAVLISFGIGRGLSLCGMVFSDALRRIFFFLLLVLLLMLMNITSLGGGFYYAVFCLRRVASYLLLLLLLLLLVVVVVVVVDVYDVIRFGSGLILCVFLPTG